MIKIDDQIVDDLGQYTHDPQNYMLYAYPWGEGALEGVSGPRKWQSEINALIKTHLSNPKTRFEPLLIAVASGHGIGKSAEISMLLDWALSTCENTKALVTANTDTQLRTKTMPEITKWSNMMINKDWFEVTATAIYSKWKNRSKTWRMDAVPWSAHNTEAFAGLHNKLKRIVVVFDEGSKIDDKIYEVTEGALTDEDTEIIWIVFGNPTRNTGRFKDCFGKYKHRWHTMQIDSRDVEGTNKEQLQKWVDDYGEDSDFVKVRVRGMFPSASFKQFISTADADAAYGKHLRIEQYDWAPKIITVDPAWEGDDELVIGLRQGLMFKILKVIPKNDNDIEVANYVAKLEDEHNADAVFIDGGYGTGIISAGRTMKRNWQIVWFGGKSPDDGYVNMRAYIWGKARDWLKEGGAIPKDTVLHADLISPETVSRLDGKIQLESKKDMKMRGLPSPGRADSLALSFAYNVRSKKTHVSHAKPRNYAVEYDPLK